jgi:hypothetical protein
MQTIVGPFRRRSQLSLAEPIEGGLTIKFSKEVKVVLGVKERAILKLLWRVEMGPKGKKFIG